MAVPISSDLDVFVFKKIDHSVGNGGSNRKGDVQMIQFLLNVIHLDPGNSFRMPSLLLIDGVCGPRTLDAIRGYQEAKKEDDFPLVTVDGLVTATQHAIFVDPHHAGVSTIFHLNWDYVQALPRANFAIMGAYVGYIAEPLLSTVIVPLQKAGVI
jgi:hypothetical protein